MPEQAPPLRDQPHSQAEFVPLSTERLVEYARQSVRNVQAGRRSMAIHRAQKLWVSPSELFTFAALAEPDPWPQPVSGCEVLLALVSFLQRHSRLDETGAHVVALWVAHCWCIENVDISPRLAITGATSSVGKSTLLKLVASLVPRPLVLARAGVKPLLYLIDAAHPTLLLDDADQWAFATRGVRDVLMVGHTADAAYLNPTSGVFEPLAHSCFTPCAYSFSAQPPAELLRRSVVVSLSPPGPSDAKQPEPITPPAEACEQLKAQLVRWVRDEAGASASVPAPGLASLSTARRSNWRPLFALARAAGKGWTERVVAAASKLTAGEERDLGIELLDDVRSKLSSLDRMTSVDLVAALLKDADRPWQRLPNGRKLDVRSLAKSLAPFGVRPRVMRTPHDAFARGYHTADFADAFARHLEPTPAGQACVNT